MLDRFLMWYMYNSGKMLEDSNNFPFLVFVVRKRKRSKGSYIDFTRLFLAGVKL